MINEITNIVGDIVSKIDNSVTGVYNTGSGLTEYCDTKWMRKGKTLTDSLSNQFLIEGITYNESVEATQISSPPLVDLEGLTFLDTPFYLSGTKIAADNEWTRASKDLTTKTPLIWLLEVLTEQKFGRGDNREFSTSLRIFFLDETDVRQFKTEDHRREVVYPMSKLVESFLDVIRVDRRFQTIEDYQLITFSRFGVERQDGMFENILDANLSGVELRLDLVKYKENCKC